MVNGQLLVMIFVLPPSISKVLGGFETLIMSQQLLFMSEDIQRRIKTAAGIASTSQPQELNRHTSLLSGDSLAEGVGRERKGALNGSGGDGASHLTDSQEPNGVSTKYNSVTMDVDGVRKTFFILPWREEFENLNVGDILGASRSYERPLIFQGTQNVGPYVPQANGVLLFVFTCLEYKNILLFLQMTNKDLLQITSIVSKHIDGTMAKETWFDKRTSRRKRMFPRRPSKKVNDKKIKLAQDALQKRRYRGKYLEELEHCFHYQPLVLVDESEAENRRTPAHSSVIEDEDDGGSGRESGDGALRLNPSTISTWSPSTRTITLEKLLICYISSELMTDDKQLFLTHLLTKLKGCFSTSGGGVPFQEPGMTDCNSVAGTDNVRENFVKINTNDNKVNEESNTQNSGVSAEPCTLNNGVSPEPCTQNGGVSAESRTQNYGVSAETYIKDTCVNSGLKRPFMISDTAGKAALSTRMWKTRTCAGRWEDYADFRIPDREVTRSDTAEQEEGDSSMVRIAKKNKSTAPDFIPLVGAKEREAHEDRGSEVTSAGRGGAADFIPLTGFGGADMDTGADFIPLERTTDSNVIRVGKSKSGSDSTLQDRAVDSPQAAHLDNADGVGLKKLKSSHAGTTQLIDFIHPQKRKQRRPRLKQQPPIVTVKNGVTFRILFDQPRTTLPKPKPKPKPKKLKKASKTEEADKPDVLHYCIPCAYTTGSVKLIIAHERYFRHKVLAEARNQLCAHNMVQLGIAVQPSERDTCLKCVEVLEEEVVEEYRCPPDEQECGSPDGNDEGKVRQTYIYDTMFKVDYDRIQAEQLYAIKVEKPSEVYGDEASGMAERENERQPHTADGGGLATQPKEAAEHQDYDGPPDANAGAPAMYTCFPSKSPHMLPDTSDSINSFSIPCKSQADSSSFSSIPPKPSTFPGYSSAFPIQADSTSFVSSSVPDNYSSFPANCSSFPADSSTFPYDSDVTRPFKRIKLEGEEGVGVTGDTSEWQEEKTCLPDARFHMVTKSNIMKRRAKSGRVIVCRRKFMCFKKNNGGGLLKRRTVTKRPVSYSSTSQTDVLRPSSPYYPHPLLTKPQELYEGDLSITPAPIGTLGDIKVPHRLYDKKRGRYVDLDKPKEYYNFDIDENGDLCSVISTTDESKNKTSATSEGKSCEEDLFFDNLMAECNNNNNSILKFFDVAKLDSQGSLVTPVASPVYGGNDHEEGDSFPSPGSYDQGFEDLWAKGGM